MMEKWEERLGITLQLGTPEAMTEKWAEWLGITTKVMTEKRLVIASQEEEWHLESWHKTCQSSTVLSKAFQPVGRSISVVDNPFCSYNMLHSKN